MHWLELLFDYSVTKSGCWEVNFGSVPEGRSRRSGLTRPQIMGRTRAGSKCPSAARVVCAATHGLPPDQAMHAAHSCHNRLCINPDHVSWQYPIENIRLFVGPAKPRVRKKREYFKLDGKRKSRTVNLVGV